MCNDISTMKVKFSQQVESFMGNDTRFQCKNKQNINAIESTDERITSRTGLALFAGGI